MPVFLLCVWPVLGVFVLLDVFLEAFLTPDVFFMVLQWLDGDVALGIDILLCKFQCLLQSTLKFGPILAVKAEGSIMLSFSHLVKVSLDKIFSSIYEIVLTRFLN